MMSITTLSVALTSGTSEYALHILFTNFVRIVEEKMQKVMAIPVDVEPDIPAHFGAGADPAFDKVLASLGHISSHEPTPVINTVMFWRKVRSDGVADGTSGSRSFTPTPANVPPSAAAAITAGIKTSTAMIPSVPLPPSAVQHAGSTPPALIRRQTEPVSVNTSQGQENGRQYGSQQTGVAQHILRDRQQCCTIYILCRALIEVVKHTTADALTDDIASRLEDIVFRQLITQDAEDFYRGSAIKTANFNIFAELLGCFSNIRFVLY
jgi:hypothetical protein